MLTNSELDLEFFALSYLLDELNDLDLHDLGLKLDPTLGAHEPSHEDLYEASKVMFLLQHLIKTGSLQLSLDKAKELKRKDSMSFAEQIKDVLKK